LALIEIVVEIRFAGREQQGREENQGQPHTAWQ
jgi:hypothetical protein